MLSLPNLALFALVLINSTVCADSAEGYLSKFEREVLDELNHARTHPLQYAGYLAQLSRFFYGRELRRPGEVILITQEGLPALEEAIAYLETVQPVAPLIPSKGLSQGAADHARDQARNGALGHTGSDDSQPWERMNRYGVWQVAAAENISYGDNDARGVLIQLIVDDGTPGRGHRTNIFNPDYRFVGVACGPHAQFGMMCVMDYAGEYSESPRN
jgi:hypothetical protein